MDGTSLSFQDVLNAVLQGSGANWALKVIPLDSSQTGTAPREVNYRQTLLHQFTTASGSGTGTVLGSIGQYRRAELFYHVTLATGTSATLLGYIDSRLDGTNWVNVGQFAVTTGTVKSQAVHVTKERGDDAVYAATDVTADAGAGSFRPFGWGDDMRVRLDIVGTSPSYSGRVWVNLA